MDGMAGYLALASTAAILLILVAIAVGALYRALHLSISGITEITEFLILIAMFLGFAYVGHTKSHIKVELIVHRFPPRLQNLAAILSSVMILFFFLAIMYGGIKMDIHSYLVGEYKVAIPGIPVWIIRAFIPIGSLAAILVAAVDLVKEIADFIYKRLP